MLNNNPELGFENHKGTTLPQKTDKLKFRL